MNGTSGRLAELGTLHTRFPLAGQGNDLLTADPALLEYLLSILRQDPAPPPERSPQEWLEFLALLNGHGIRPVLAFHLLKQPGVFRPPGETFDLLRRDLLRSGAVAMQDDLVLAGLLERLRDEGIAPLLLKGAALSRSVYPDPALRPGSDIDMLVREDQLEACSDIIRGMGYTAPYDFHAFSRFTTPHQVFLPPMQSPMAKPLELHWGLGQGFAQDSRRLEGLFSRSISVPYAAFEFRTLGHADHLAFCAHHALYHHGDGVRLSWICDLAYLARGLAKIDWQSLPGRAVDYRARIATETGLRMAVAWTGTPDVAEAGHLSDWPAPSRAELSDWDHVAVNGSPKLRVLRMQLHFIPSPLGKVRYLIGSTFPPRKKIQFDCPAPAPPRHLRAFGSTYLYQWIRYWRHK